MKQLNLFWTELQPHLARLPEKEQEKLKTAFERATNGASLIETKYQRAIRDRAAVHALLKKSSEDLIQRYQTIFENSGTAMAVIEHDGTISLVNTLFLNLFGYRREDVENRINVFALFDEQFRDQVRDYHRRRRTGDATVPHRYEARVMNSEGKILDVIIMIGLFLGTGQSVASVIDITDRKRMEDELGLFKASADHAYDEVFWLDFDGNMLYVNDSATHNTGYSREELLAMKIFELDPDFDPAIWQGFVANLRVEGTQLFTTRHRRKSGEIMDVEIVANYVTKDSHEYSFAFVRDITERKRMTDELRLFKASVDHANDEIFWFDFEANILYANDSASRITGYSREELLAMKVYELNPVVNPDMWAGFMATLRKDGGLRFETRHRRKNGEIMDVEIVANYVTKDKSEYSIAFVRDITERKHAEKELAESKEYLARIFSSIKSGIMVIDAETHTIVNVNTAAAEMIGLDETEIIDKVCHQYICPTLCGKCPITDLHLTVDNAERMLITADGRQLPIIKDVVPVTLHGRECLVETFIDNTGRKHAEEALIQKKDELEAAYEQMTAVEQELRINFENLTETEKKLRESEAWSREFAELLPQFVYEIDTNGRLIFVNQYATDVFGITRQTLDAGLNMRDIIIPEEWDQVQRNLAQILAGKKTTLDVYHLRRKDGSLMPTNISTAPVYRDGVLRGFRGIVVDITESLRTQEALLKSESRFRELAELLPQIVFELDENLKFTFFNWNTIEMTGFAYDDLSQKRTGINDIIRESDRKSAERFFARILKDSTSGHLECSIVSLDGKEIPVTIYASPIIGENRVAGVRGVIVDIAEQKSLELALRESELRFRELAGLIPQFIFETDRNFRFTYFNLAGMALTGYSDEDFAKGLDIFSLVDIADRGSFRELCSKVLMGENVVPLQFSLMTSDQTRVPVIMYASHIFRGNEYAGIRGIIVDIADQKRLERSLATLNQKLNMMNSVTRHDVLNNITGLLGLVDMLGEITTDSNAQVLISEIRNLIMAIKDQIIFTKDYQSLGVKAPQWQSLCHDIRYAATTIGRDNVQVKMPESDAEIYADPFFGRVFYNLIDNSNRHGGSVRFISIETEVMPDKSLMIRYRDDGIGVPPDEKELIFEQGYGKNTGFGLFIIREILGITGLSIRETGIFRSGVLFEIAVPKESWRPATVNECGD
jgi:PAS domain S-box-containing protein